MKKFYLTQTALKDLENDDTCPYRWKEQWIEGNVPFTSSEAMDKGSYFEWLVLGAGAISGTEVTDLTRLKTGAKSTDQLRIEEQAQRVKNILFDPTDPEFLGFTVVNTQKDLRREEPTPRKGTQDIEALDEEGTPWVLDLKLTKDITADHSKYGYGNPWEELDLVQLSHYQDLYEQQEGVRPKCGLIVADYTAQKRIVFGEIVISNRKRAEKEERFSSAERAIALYNNHGWVKTPNNTECGKCPLKCEMRAKASKIIKKKVNY